MAFIFSSFLADGVSAVALTSSILGHFVWLQVMDIFLCLCRHSFNLWKMKEQKNCLALLSGISLWRDLSAWEIHFSLTLIHCLWAEWSLSGDSTFTWTMHLMINKCERSQLQWQSLLANRCWFTFPQDTQQQQFSFCCHVFGCLTNQRLIFSCVFLQRVLFA